MNRRAGASITASQQPSQGIICSVYRSRSGWQTGTPAGRWEVVSHHRPRLLTMEKPLQANSLTPPCTLPRALHHLDQGLHFVGGVGQFELGSLLSALSGFFGQKPQHHRALVLKRAADLTIQDPLWLGWGLSPVPAGLGLTLGPRLASNSRQSSCLGLLCVEVTVHHHALTQAPLGWAGLFCACFPSHPHPLPTAAFVGDRVSPPSRRATLPANPQWPPRPACCLGCERCLIISDRVQHRHLLASGRVHLGCPSL